VIAIPYLNYNHALYRTGFRPYGHTNAWAASQLNGYSTPEAVLSGYLGQSRPFEPGGGWKLHGLGQSRAFAPWTLHGGMAVCLDQSENTIACMDPNCTYGDCGSNAEQLVGGSLCLDFGQNQVPCSSPSCSYGDCTDKPKGSGPVVINLPPGPANRVGVPPSQAAQTAPGYQPPSGVMASTMIKGIPDIFLYVFAGLAAFSFIGGGGGRRR
jgi:hypothetical protein